MFGNLKLATKVIISFIFLITMAGFVYYEGYGGMNNISSRTNEIVKTRLPGIESVLGIADAQDKVLIGERGLINNKMMNPDIRKAQYDYIEANLKSAEEMTGVYKTLAKTKKEEELWTAFAPLWNEWKKGEDNLVAMMREKDRLLAAGSKSEDGAVVDIDNKALSLSFENRKVYLATSRILGDLSKENISEGLRLSRIVDQEFESSVNKMSVAMCIAILMALIVGWFFVGNVKKIIASLLDESRKLTEAAVNGKLDKRAEPDRVDFEFREVMEGMNRTLDAVIQPLNVAAEYVDRISKGDMPPKITDNYNGDFNEIKNNLNQCVEAIALLVYDANSQAQAAADGKLQTRADVSKHKGEFKKVVEGINRIFDPVNALVADATMLAREAVEGRLATRADISKHQGDYRKIVEGINETLNAVVDPVKEARECLEEMSRGNLEVSVTGNYKGDHAILKNALNSTLDAINEILSQVNVAVDQVNSGASQVSDASQSLSQSSTEAASSLEQVSASMQEVNAQTKQNAENATQANRLSTMARVSAETGNAQMKQMLRAMSDINESAASISKIIKAIDEIAFQTNILALNAAVEAARAGIHGKGFTVVAEEVRNLAQRSARAAKETAEMIENSIKKTEAGTKIADETSKALDEIVIGSTKVTDLIGEIESACKEQAQAVLQINQGLEQVDHVTQQNNATAEQSAAASEELSGQSLQLKDMLGKFRLRKNDRLSLSYISSDAGAAKPENRQTADQPHKIVSIRSLALKTKKAASARKAEEVIALDDKEYGKF